MGRKSQILDPAVAELRELESLLEQAREGFKARLPRLRQLLGTHPDVVKRLGDPAALAEEAWVRCAAGGAADRMECLKIRVAQLRVELSGPNLTTVERQLVDRAVMHWLRMSYYDRLAAQSADGRKQDSQAEELARRAQRDYLAVLDMLEARRRGLGTENSQADEPRRPANRPVAAGRRRLAVDHPDTIPIATMANSRRTRSRSETPKTAFGN